MKLVLCILAVLLAASWVVGFFIFKTGMFIHVLMIMAALLLIQAIIISPKPNRIADAE
jgi:cytochrome c oxidase subunit IV